uniref:BLTX327 n=1 Tax=Parasteatoda tepidariorum TaxID=114398 RepID=A0A2L2Y7C1_PARTP
MKTEVFVGTPKVKTAANVISSTKSTTEDPVSILLLDTPHNTPIGTPGSDITADEILEQIQR